MGPVQIALLVGIAGTWLFMTIALGAASWMLWRSDASSVSGEVPRTQDEGPLVWFTNLTMEGGPLQGRNVFTLQFNGRNSSQKEVALKDANIISAVNGSKLALDIVAGNEIVPIEQIALIPPGAPIRLVAKFGPPAEQPGKIMGLEPKVFLETWRQFFFNVEDDTRKYRIPYNEGHLAVFFPGMVGPHVSKKSGGK